MICTSDSGIKAAVLNNFESSFIFISALSTSKETHVVKG